MTQTDLGPYRIIRKIATGGMAEIFLARQRSLEGLERTVVLKRVHPRYSKNDEFVTMFLDEARLMAALSHPNIAQVFDVGKINSSYFLVMEYVRGPTLGELLQAALRKFAHGLPPRESVSIAVSIAEALHYVHERHDELGRRLNIVHRDLNPANVIVSYDGAVKLIDFGIAKTAYRVYETRTGVIKGTYGYIAPEQFTSAAPVDHRADIFALGVILYEMSVGKHPFDVSDEQELLERIFAANYKRPRQVNPRVPQALDSIISGCLAPHPEGRPEDVPALIGALIGYVADERLIATMSDVAALTRELVPDRDGPAPLRKRTISSVLQAPRREPTSTQSVARQRLNTLPIPASAGTEEATVGPPSSVDSAHRTIEVHPDLDLDVVPASELTEQLRAPPDRADGSRRASERAKRRPPSSRVVVHSQPLSSDTMTRRFPIRRLTLVVPLIALAAVLAILLVFQLRTPNRAASPNLERREDVAEVASPTEHRLSIISEPSGAQVWINGRLIGKRTPVTVTLPIRQAAVWVKVSLNAHVAQEREVQAAAGEARFVLKARK